jgi:copper chaperone CopZ
MFEFLKNKQPKGEVITLKISGMHCSSCAMSIDDSLEEATGVLKSDTSYAKGVTKVLYNPQLISVSQIQEVIRSLDYSSEEKNS